MFLSFRGVFHSNFFLSEKKLAVDKLLFRMAPIGCTFKKLEELETHKGKGCMVVFFVMYIYHFWFVLL